MSNVQEVLTVSGVLPSIQAGGSRVVTPELKDGAGNFLSINSVSLSNGLYAVINNGASPPNIQVFNPLQNGPVANANYTISHLHTIQAQYPTPTAATIGADTAPDAASAQGAIEMYRNTEQALAAGTHTIVYTEEQAAGTIGSLVAQDQAAGRFVFQAASIPRIYEVTAVVTASDDTAEEVTISLVQDPDGAATVVAVATQTAATIGDIVSLSLQALIAVDPLATQAARTYEIRLTQAAGAVVVAPGPIARGASFMVRSI